MKKLTFSAIAALAVASQASPTYLTFEGAVYNSYDYPYSTMHAPAAIGSWQTVVLKIDQAAPGDVHIAGTTYLEPMYSPIGNDTYFYAELISGLSVTGGNGNPTTFGLGDPDIYGKEYHYGIDYGVTHEGFAFGVSGPDQSGSENHFNISSDPSVVYTSIEIGQTYFTISDGYDATGYSTRWYGNFTLTHKSDTAPGTGGGDLGGGGLGGGDPGAVPEPGSLALLGLGLVALAGASRKRGKSRA